MFDIDNLIASKIKRGKMRDTKKTTTMNMEEATKQPNKEGISQSKTITNENALPFKMRSCSVVVSPLNLAKYHANIKKEPTAPTGERNVLQPLNENVIPTMKKKNA